MKQKTGCNTSMSNIVYHNNITEKSKGGPSIQCVPLIHILFMPNQSRGLKTF